MIEKVCLLILKFNNTKRLRIQKKKKKRQSYICYQIHNKIIILLLIKVNFKHLFHPSLILNIQLSYHHLTQKINNNQLAKRINNNQLAKKINSSLLHTKTLLKTYKYSINSINNHLMTINILLKNFNYLKNNLTNQLIYQTNSKNSIILIIHRKINKNSPNFYKKNMSRENMYKLHLLVPIYASPKTNNSKSHMYQQLPKYSLQRLPKYPLQ